MEAVLSREIQAGLDAARRASLRKSSRLRVDVDGTIYPVLRMGTAGFWVALEDAPHLRGLVDIYDGANHLFQCLVVAGDADGDEMLYTFKRATAVTDRAPLDFERAPDAPVALIEDAGPAY